MGDRTGRTGPSNGHERARDAGEGRRFRRVLAVPVAIAGSIAVTLGIVQPADAAVPAPKRQPTPKGLVPGAPQAAEAVATVAAAPPEYTVAEGDTVSGIAERFGLATPDILALNGLGWSSLIFPGQRLVLRAASAAPQPAPVPPAHAEIARHVVVEGDTMSGIAAQNGLGLDALLSANGLSRTSLIFPGQSIVLPPASAAPAVPAAPAAVPAPAPAPVPAEPAAPVAAPLTDEMRQHARVIVEVGRSLGVPDQGLVVALAAAAQESGLRNVDYGDRDSLGLFQQRPSQGWGTPDEVRDPTRAALAFYGGSTNPNPGRTRGLLDIDGWQSMTVTQAAQAVQLSAHPDLYAKWEPQARAWLAELS